MSNPPNVTSYTWGPGAQRAAVSVTFDNLGEPADLERGLWPESEPLGRHFSVKRMLPRILGILEELGLQATFTALPGVAPYCVLGGIRVVSIAASRAGDSVFL
jgi:hypothetical protein